MKTIVIIDYGLGNLRSVLRGLEKAGARAVVSADTSAIAAADALVLPGVGAFRDGMGMLGPLEGTVRAAAREVQVLGICLRRLMLMQRYDEGLIQSWLPCRFRPISYGAYASL